MYGDSQNTQYFPADEGIFADLWSLKTEAKKIYGEWSPIQDQRRDLKLDYINRGLIQGMAQRVPYEQELLEEIYGPQTEWDNDFVPMVPDWMDPVYLRDHAKLEDIGVPDHSPDFDAVRLGLTTKTKRTNKKNNARVEDYTALGWPRSLGSPVRFVTPEEDREIRHRLTSFGLTMPGSEVPTIGKSLGQIVSEETTQPEWIIEGLLRRGGAMMVYGPSGIGKTWLTHTFMLMAAHGQGIGVWGMDTNHWILRAGEHQGVKVCLVDGEMIEADIAERTRVLCHALGIGLEQKNEGDPTCSRSFGDVAALRDNIQVYAKAAQDHRAEFVDLANREWINRVITFAKEQSIEVVIFDNLATLSPTLEDENSAVSWSPMNDMIVALKREKIAVILVHHAGKNGSYRGSTNIFTTLETVVKLEKPESPQDQGDACFGVTIEKSRNHGLIEIDGRMLRLKENRWSLEIDEFSMASIVVERIRSLRYVNQNEVGDALRLSQGHVSKIRAKAVALRLATDEELKDCFRRARAIRKTDALGTFLEVESEDADANLLDI
jgi:hypothetical protein